MTARLTPVGAAAVPVAAADADWVAVELFGLDLALWDESDQHHASLLREVALIAGASPDDRAHLPARLLALVERVQAEFADSGEAIDAVRRQALADGHAHLDLAVPVPPDAGPAAQELHDLLDELDEYCATGALLTVPTAPEVAGFRRWYLRQFASQVDGAPPVSWPAWRASHPSPATA